VLTRLRVKLALRLERAASAFQKQINTLAAREFAFRTSITGHVASP